MRRPTLLVLAVLGAVATVDQATKAWAWRHLDDVDINSGASLLVSRFGAVMRDPVRGAVVDVLDSVLLVAAALALARWSRSRLVVVSGALVLGGWTSNLFDRLGLHRFTAPGSVRGAVDWIRWNGAIWNLADFAIIAGALGLLSAVLAAGARRLAGRRRPAADRVPVTRHRRRATLAGLAATAVISTTLATIGALAYAGGSSRWEVLAAGR